MPSMVERGHHGVAALLEDVPVGGDEILRTGQRRHSRGLADANWHPRCFATAA
jgi:hypothetical protein